LAPSHLRADSWDRSEAGQGERASVLAVCILPLIAIALTLVGPIVTGRVLEAGGFAWAGPWAGFLGLIALIAAWRILPEAIDEVGPTS
jgi:hypothetical protein